MIAHLRRLYDNPIVLVRLPRDYWFAVQSQAAARHASTNDIVREALANLAATAGPASSSSLRTFRSHRGGVRSWITGRVSRSRFFRWSRRLAWTMRMRANHGVCSIEIANPDVGFFAHLYHCLRIFQYCERRGLVPDIRITSVLYLDPERGPNWLDYFFDTPRAVSSDEIARRVRYTKKISHTEELGFQPLTDMSLGESARLLNIYLSPKPQITMIVDRFWERVGECGPVVGVHYRGTDKSLEAPPASWEHCLNILRRYLSDYPTTGAIFVASDEQPFIEFIRNSIRQTPVYFHADHFRSNDRRPVHTEIVGGGYEKGEDALVNALLLSRCTAVIRTTSNLSAWASLFNPDLKVILLNKPYDNRLWYPEDEILRQPRTEYLPQAVR